MLRGWDAGSSAAQAQGITLLVSCGVDFSLQTRVCKIQRILSLSLNLLNSSLETHAAWLVGAELQKNGDLYPTS